MTTLGFWSISDDDDDGRGHIVLMEQKKSAHLAEKALASAAA
jgi:hypothetical protein